jgi:sodium-dependent phosphate cotransporter
MSEDTSQVTLAGSGPAPHNGHSPSPLYAGVAKVLLVVGVLYLFLLSIGLMGEGFKACGKGFAEALLETTANPFVGLFAGILTTAIIQSSSTTTSMVVAFVAAGSLTVESAIPIVMGANVGTAVTCTLVSLGHITRRGEFQRAFAAGTIHDMFNLLTVIVLFPIEMFTGYLHKTAGFLSEHLAGSGGMTFESPLNAVTKPVVHASFDFLCGFGLPPNVTAVTVLVLSLIVLIASLFFLSKLLKSLVLHKLEVFFERALGRSGAVAILIGLVFTCIVQSSSVTTSLMVPMAAAGVMRLEQVYPVALGANVGTTITALLAALATGRIEGLTIALAHTVFNISGILVFYPLAPLRRIPLGIARGLATLAGRNRLWAIGFVVVVFFLIPGMIILVT